MTLTHANGFERVLYTDGRTASHETPRGDTVQVSAAWVDGSLVVTHTRDEFTGTQTFTVSGDGATLTVVMAGDGPRGSRSHSRVYTKS